MEVDLEGVALGDLQTRKAGLQRFQSGNDVAIDLDDAQCAAAFEDRNRQGAEPRADLDEDLSGPRVDGAHDPFDHVGIVQEVLSKALLGGVSADRGPAHRVLASARSMARRKAAARLPAEARPLPARSRAVP